MADVRICEFAASQNKYIFEIITMFQCIMKHTSILLNATQVSFLNHGKIDRSSVRSCAATDDV
jgi:hypothetical protein